MKLAPLVFAFCKAECPCKEIGEELSFGKVTVNNEHADQERGHKFYAHVHTPVGPVQQEEYTFILEFNQPVTNFVQHNFLTDFTDGDRVAVLRKSQNRISGEPYTFNIDGNMQEEGLTFRAWYCAETSQATVDDRCDAMDVDMDMDDETHQFGSGDMTDHSGDQSNTTNHSNISANNSADSNNEWRRNDDFKFSYLTRSAPMAFSAARKFCKTNEGTLPSPQSLIANDALAMLIDEPTWVNVNLRPSLKQSYVFNNYVKYGTLLMKNGDWEIHPLESKARVLCIKPDGELCHFYVSLTVFQREKCVHYNYYMM